MPSGIGDLWRTHTGKVHVIVATRTMVGREPDGFPWVFACGHSADPCSAQGGGPAGENPTNADLDEWLTCQQCRRRWLSGD